MSVETVREYLKQFALDGRLMEFECSSATVELAAAAIGTEPQRIAKSLTFYGKDGACVMIVTSGDRKIDNAKFKAELGFKARMMSAEDALASTGHAIGGVCPFALPQGICGYLDLSLRRFDRVYPAAGSANSAVALDCDELERAVGDAFVWADLCKTTEG